MAKATQFWDKIADRYARRPVADQSAYEEKLRVTRSYLRPGMQIFEFGCGTGSTAIAHAPYVERVLATDLSARMIAIAKDKALAAGVANVDFKQQTIESAALAPSSQDAVLGLSILHLLDDKQRVMRQVFAMLKPGGAFISNTACIGDTMRYFKLIAPLGRRLGLIPYVEVFTTAELVQALQSAGFVVDYQWQSGKGKAVFIVALKPDAEDLAERDAE